MNPNANPDFSPANGHPLDAPLRRAGAEFRAAAAGRPLPSLDWGRVEAALAGPSGARRGDSPFARLRALLAGDATPRWASAAGYVFAAVAVAVAAFAYYGPARQIGSVQRFAGAGNALGAPLPLMEGDVVAVAEGERAIVSLDEAVVYLASGSSAQFHSDRLASLEKGELWLEANGDLLPIAIAAGESEVSMEKGAARIGYDGDDLSAAVARGEASLRGPKLARRLAAGDSVSHQSDSNELRFDLSGIAVPRWARPASHS